jgi:hypothetical protein
LIEQKVKEKMKEVDQVMDTVEVQWEFTESEWQKQTL